jgi:peptidoglycan hydrolase-like protein with peptidoglycan-binding domain
MSTQIVQSVQTRLQELGYYAGKIDGDAGPNTEAALADFKAAHGFVARPYPVIQTLHMLFDEDARAKARPIVKGEPAWMVEARSVTGLHEVKDYAELAAWLRSDGPTLGDPRKLPWCGDFVQTAIKLTLPNEAIPENPYLARNWLKFGVETKPRLGAVMVFWRGSRNGISGHVAFYVGEDAGT